MNLKQALDSGMKQRLFKQCRIHFNYNRDTGKIQKVVSSPALANFEYVTGLKGDEQKQWVQSMQDPKFAENFKNTFVGVETVLADSTFLQGKYHMIRIDGVLAPVSHFVWFLETGEAPGRLTHIDSDHENTVFSNLKPFDKGAGVKIVVKKYPCRITVGDKIHYIGTFPSKEARDRARDRYCTENGIPKLKQGRPTGSTKRDEDRKPVKPYQAVVLYGGRQYNLGRFDTREQVKQAREAFRKAREVGMVAAAPDKPAVVAVELPARMVIEPVAPKETTTSQELPDWMR